VVENGAKYRIVLVFSHDVSAKSSSELRFHESFISLLRPAHLHKAINDQLASSEAENIYACDGYIEDCMNHQPISAVMAQRAKRGPTVLVTDAREASFKNAAPRPQLGQRQGTGVISVDNVLQYSSEIPSALPRGVLTPRPAIHYRTPSGRHPLDPKLTGRLIPQHIPSRTSKVSEKLVLLPETGELDAEKAAFEEEDETAPPKDEELERRRTPGLQEKSYAERLPKSKRTEKLPRVTAYCTAQAYKMRSTADFIRSKHGTRTKLYDDCLYVVYQLPLMPGHEGYRVRSSPVLKTPGGRSVLDEEIERNERLEHHHGYFEEEQYQVKYTDGGMPSPLSQEEQMLNERAVSPQDSPRRTSSPIRVPPNALSFAEMFVFTYGVVVFWNFTERQEKDILADLTFSTSETHIVLAIRPLQEEDFETEEFHFEYNPDIPRPRIFNDMITLRSGDHMIKLAMSHAIAQSTKLSFFEERMSTTMTEAQPIPRRLALTGRLGMKREEVVRILGRLFTSRVDVNLSSNVLDVPNFFWDSEPTLHPLYNAVREYLEIGPRVKVLNERCRVFLDLTEILSEGIADVKMTRITWIIIVLIVLSILVTCSEVFLRFGILAKSKHTEPGVGTLMTPLPMTTPRNFARVGLVASWIIVGTSSFL